MKQHYILFLLFFSIMGNAQIVNIPDANFKAKLLAASPTANIAKNEAGALIKIDTNNDSEIQVSEALTVYRLVISSFNISDLTGIESFTNIKELFCVGNDITTLDLTALSSLKTLDCHNNNLSSIVLPVSLVSFDCSRNLFTTLNLDGFPNLQILGCKQNNLTSLTLAGDAELIAIGCDDNELTSLNLSGCAKLVTLVCNNNSLSMLDIHGLAHLNSVDCSHNQLIAIDFTGLIAVTSINCSYNSLTAIDWPVLPLLGTFDCSFNPGLTSLAPVGLDTISSLFCNNCSLSTITLSGVPTLTQLHCQNNNLTTLDVSTYVNFYALYCDNNQLTSLLVNPTSAIQNLSCSHNQLTQLASPLMGGIFNCSYNLLTSLPPLVVPNTYLYCSHNLLTSIQVSGAKVVDCSYNQLTSLDISQNNNLYKLDCSNNLLQSLSIQATGDLYELKCSFNQLSDINTTGISEINYVYCTDNLFQSIRFEDINFYQLDCRNNQYLQALYVKNGADNEVFSLSGCPSLAYICADLGQVADLYVFDGDISNVEINSYCDYTPGSFYEISGHQKFDADSNGCDQSDVAFPNIHFNITNGVTEGTIISDLSGNYNIHVQAGTHILTPIFEQPYYTISPTSVAIGFPASESPAVQDFCIIPNGVHADVEISVFNINAAIPGFDAKYRIVYKNKGTTTASGVVNLSFDDTVLDLVIANPITDNQSTGTLSWNYANLQPFESRIINFTLNLNSPVESPPLNQNDILNFTSNILLTDDETPLDNSSALSQTVLNALDPNDKTCLEGDTITPEMIGEYVHYKIRFENTGNYPAAIVTVKDVIDTSKFDISTLTPVIASHPFITRITNTNQVEFIFDNIMLPFDDANNDGYVIFKIKTKPTLVLGDELSNTAGIYFNYNAPVITNTAVTTVALPLGIGGNENTFGFAIYPNPVKNVLNISSKVNANIDTVIIYNMLGQEVMKALPASGESTIDVSKLSEGHYIIKIVSAASAWTTQFIKD